jgi:urease subunit alpha
MFGALGDARAATSVFFVSQLALDLEIKKALGLKRRVVGVRNTRSITKQNMFLNDYQPVMEVDSQTYEVRADGELLTCEPAKTLPLAQRFFLF